MNIISSNVDLEILLFIEGKVNFAFSLQNVYTLWIHNFSFCLKVADMALFIYHI